ncbi:MAG TPA: adenylate/guanylate cyclase domain-containing protein [Candidatus Limnocylindrales bacterium]
MTTPDRALDAESARAGRLLEQQIEAIQRFPGQNPNPVLRVSEDGRLMYANDASEPLRAALAIEVGQTVPTEWLERLRAAAADTPPTSIEVEAGNQTFAVLTVRVPELGVYNLYGTDITAAKVLERFPGQNPNPVLRMTPAGVLRYANDASRPITASLAIGVGDPLPEPLLGQLQDALGNSSAPSPEVAGEGGRTYRLKPVEIAEFGFVNLYGTDITAEKAIDRFPNQNPNPVLRLSRDGRLTYANPASLEIRRALGVEVGAPVPAETLARIVEALDRPADPTFELAADDRLYRVRVVSVYEFGSINLYGTDITAARQVERLNAENEALLLNILPRSIAERLRGGETVIADRLEDMTVLFADVVGFTELSSRMAAGDVVSLLNRIFTMCDRLADQFRLEKIKTVGDAYMVVGGLPVEGDGSPGGADRRSHARDVAEMGLAMLDELSRYSAESGMPLQVRVGMHSGPLVAGVIGLKKFIYDVWGDTVNTASRMESTGVAGRVQLTRETMERLGDGYRFERRGPIEVKGKGVIETWFLVGRAPEVAST